MKDFKKMPEKNQKLEDSVVSKKTKKVHFAFGITDRQAKSPQDSKPPNFKRTQTSVYRSLTNNKIENAKLCLELYSKDDLNKFYVCSNDLLFSGAISFTKKSDALAFLLSSVPREIALTTLAKDKYDLIGHFLRVQSERDKEKERTPEKKEVIAEKTRLILKLNDKNLTHAIQNIINEESITENIRSCVEAVINEETSNKCEMGFSQSSSEPEMGYTEILGMLKEDYEVLNFYLGDEDPEDKKLIVKKLSIMIKLFEKNTIKDIFINRKIDKKTLAHIRIDLESLDINEISSEDIVNYIQEWCTQIKKISLKITLKDSKEDKKKEKGEAGARDNKRITT